MPKTDNSKASMNITTDREIIEWVTETAKAEGVSRNHLVGEILGMVAGLHQLGYFYVRDRRVSFNPFRRRPEDGLNAGLTFTKEARNGPD